jgi:small multidrug resistance pump
MSYIFLTIAIVSEVIGTNALNASRGFTKIFPSIITIISYGFAFYFLSIVLKTIPVGIAYAIWSGMGIILVTVIAAIIFKQIPDVPALIGLSLIITGVIVINVFSKTVTH